MFLCLKVLDNSFIFNGLVYVVKDKIEINVFLNMLVNVNILNFFWLIKENK